MTQPNFIEIENKLTLAVHFSRTRPDSPSTRAWGDQLPEALEAFRLANTETDRSYLRWRQLLGEELTLFREIRRAWDRIRERADEHGLDGYPQRQVVYTEPEAMTRLVQDTVAFLRSHVGEWAWIEPSAKELEELLARAASRKRESDAAYASYSVFVKRRVAGYDHATHTLREYLRDVRGEVGAAAVQPFVIHEF